MQFIDLQLTADSFAFLRFLDLTPSETHSLHVMPVITRRLLAIQEEIGMAQDSPYTSSVFLSDC